MTTYSFAFLFGAGARTGIGERLVKPYLPPVMKHLYSRLAEEFPLLFGKNSVYAVHAERFKEDFEGTFADVVLKYARGGGFGPSTPPTLILLEHQGTLARYFSRFILDSAGSDCYSKLLLALKKSGMIQQSIFGSLNYECLLEQSADGLDLTVDYWCDQNHPDVVSLAKIHGSCNFVTQRFDRHQQAYAAHAQTKHRCNTD